MSRREERRDLLALCGLEEWAAGRDAPEGVDERAEPIDPETPPEVDELTFAMVSRLYAEMLETREATGCPRVRAHCDALGAILRRHEPNGYG